MAANTIGRVIVGPFAIFFTNINRTMNLPGHSHFARVTLCYRTGATRRGFPAFASTYNAVQAHLVNLTRRPFHDMTNEDVADWLFAAFDGWSHPDIDTWQGAFTLERLDLAVRGVPDAIGHADGFTTYAVERGA